MRKMASSTVSAKSMKIKALSENYVHSLSPQIIRKASFLTCIQGIEVLRIPPASLGIAPGFLALRILRTLHILLCTTARTALRTVLHIALRTAVRMPPRSPLMAREQDTLLADLPRGRTKARRLGSLRCTRPEARNSRLGWNSAGQVRLELMVRLQVQLAHADLVTYGRLWERGDGMHR